MRDHDLLQQWQQQQSHEALATLIERHRDMVYRLCLRVSRSAVEAEDLCQETFIELAHRAGTIRSTVAGWLYTVARRKAVRRLERLRSSTPLVETAANEGPDQELQEVVLLALSQLDERTRAVLVMRFMEGRSQQDIADELQCSQMTISRVIERGIPQLQNLLERGGAVLGVGALTAQLGATTAAPSSLVANLGSFVLAAKPVVASVGLTSMLAIGAVLLSVITAVSLWPSNNTPPTALSPTPIYEPHNPNPSSLAPWVVDDLSAEVSVILHRATLHEAIEQIAWQTRTPIIAPPPPTHRPTSWHASAVGEQALPWSRQTLLDWGPMHGSLQSILNRLAEEFNYIWKIDDNHVVIGPAGQLPAAKEADAVFWNGIFDAAQARRIHLGDPSMAPVVLQHVIAQQALNNYDSYTLGILRRLCRSPADSQALQKMWLGLYTGNKHSLFSAETMRALTPTSFNDTFLNEFMQRVTADEKLLEASQVIAHGLRNSKAAQATMLQDFFFTHIGKHTPAARIALVQHMDRQQLIERLQSESSQRAAADQQALIPPWSLVGGSEYAAWLQDYWQFMPVNRTIWPLFSDSRSPEHRALIAAWLEDNPWAAVHLERVRHPEAETMLRARLRTAHAMHHPLILEGLAAIAPQDQHEVIIEHVLSARDIRLRYSFGPYLVQADIPLARARQLADVFIAKSDLYSKQAGVQGLAHSAPLADFLAHGPTLSTIPEPGPGRKNAQHLRDTYARLLLPRLAALNAEGLAQHIPAIEAYLRSLTSSSVIQASERTQLVNDHIPAVLSILREHANDHPALQKALQSLQSLSSKSAATQSRPKNSETVDDAVDF